MGIFFSKAEPPPPMVLVPPLFDYPPLAARTRFAASPFSPSLPLPFVSEERDQFANPLCTNPLDWFSR
jgi:hypothetical protein